MDGQGLRQDAITCSSLISALAKGKQWALALQVALPHPLSPTKPSLTLCVHTIFLVAMVVLLPRTPVWLSMREPAPHYGHLVHESHYCGASVGNHNLVMHLAEAGVQLLLCTTRSNPILQCYIIMDQARRESTHMLVTSPWSVIVATAADVGT